MGRYIVDFICLEQRLVIELDGGQHQEQADRDGERDRWLSEQGYRVLRFWNHEVLGDTDAVLEAIGRALGKLLPSPQPSPTRGRGGGPSAP